MRQRPILSRHDTAVITPDVYHSSLVLVRGSADEYLREYTALAQKARGNRVPLAIAIITIVAGFLCMLPSAFAVLIGAVGDIEVLFSGSDQGDSFTALEISGIVLIAAGFTATFVFGWRDTRIEKALEAVKTEFGAEGLTLFWRSFTPPVPRAWELVLDAVTVEVRDRLFRLLDDGEDEVVQSAVRMLADQAGSQARQERDDAVSAVTDAREAMAREALGLA